MKRKARKSSEDLSSSKIDISRLDAAPGEPSATSGEFTPRRKYLPRFAKRRRRGGPVRLTFAGKLFVGVTVGVGFAAVNTGNNLLYLVLGLLLSLLLVSGVLSELALSGIRVKRRLPRRSFAAEEMQIELSVFNSKRRLPSYSLELEDLAEQEPKKRCYFLKVLPKTELVATYRRKPLSRGCIRFTEVHVRTRYPFGLIQKTRVVRAPSEFVVFPALLPSNALSESLPEEEAYESEGRLGFGEDVAGLREYRPGDEAGSIHWGRTARLGKLVVREREIGSSRRYSFFVDSACPTPREGEVTAPKMLTDWEERFERRISEVAGQVIQILEQGHSVEVRSTTSRAPRVPAGGSPDPILHWLALLESENSDSTCRSPYSTNS